MTESRRHAVRYIVTCAYCGTESNATQKRLYCDSECRRQFYLLSPEDREAVRLAVNGGVTVIDDEVRRLQRKQKADQAARKLKEEIQAMGLSFVGMSELELEAYRDAMKEKVMQGRSKVFAYHVGFGPGL